MVGIRNGLNYLRKVLIGSMKLEFLRLQSLESAMYSKSARPATARNVVQVSIWVMESLVLPSAVLHHRTFAPEQADIMRLAIANQLSLSRSCPSAAPAPRNGLSHSR